jgi:hypothetical protein
MLRDQPTIRAGRKALQWDHPNLCLKCGKRRAQLGQMVVFLFAFSLVLSGQLGVSAIKEKPRQNGGA